MTERLTRREWLVWCLWTNGANRAQIAYSIGVTEGTISTFTTRISRKLDTRGPAGAAGARVERHRPLV